MSRHCNHSRLQPWLRVAMIMAMVCPAWPHVAGAAPTRAESRTERPIIFAVDPVLGQAYIAAGSSEAVAEQVISVHNLASRREIGTIPYSDPPSAIGVNPLTGLVYVANSAQETVTVIHGPTLRTITTARITGGPQTLLVEPSSGRLYVGLAREESIRVLDMATLTTIGTVAIDLVPETIGFDRVRKRIFVTASSADGTQHAVVTLDNERLVTLHRLPLPEQPDGLAVLEGLGRLYIPIAPDGDLLIVDVEQQSIIKRLRGFDSRVRDLAVNERRSRLYLAAGDSDLVIALDPLTGGILGSVETGAATDALAVDPATARIYAASADTSTVDLVADPVGPTRVSDELRITFKVTGGLAGLNDVLTVEPPGRAELQRRVGGPVTAELGSSRFHELVALFNESDFFTMRPLHAAPRPIPDALTFSVTAKDPQREHTVVMSTSSSPPAALVDIVRRLERLRQELVSAPSPFARGLKPAA